MMRAQEAIAQQASQEVKIGKRFSLNSKALGEERAYFVYLPESYHDNKYAPQRYPVLYLLDGEAFFLSTSGVVQFMSMASNIQIPELIIVAIPNTNRTRDFTPTHSKIDLGGKERAFFKDSGGGSIFLQFIQDELCPEIESTYRTLNFRIFVGHSMGGVIVLHSLLDTPEMFQAYIAIDPSLWWDDQELVHRGENLVKEHGNLHGSVYISLANNPDVGIGNPIVMKEAGRTFAKYLESAASPKFRSTLEYFESEDHGSVPLLSLYRGLLYIFEGYKPLLNDLLNQPSALKTHFERISERLGVVLLPPEAIVNQTGYGLIYQYEDVDKAIELFKLNVSCYPKSYNVYDSLGEAYMVKDEKMLAIKNFEKSLELNPANENSKKQLQKLKSKKD